VHDIQHPHECADGQVEPQAGAGDFAAAREALELLDVEVERFRSLLPVLIAGSPNS